MARWGAGEEERGDNLRENVGKEETKEREEEEEEEED